MLREAGDTVFFLGHIQHYESWMWKETQWLKLMRKKQQTLIQIQKPWCYGMQIRNKNNTSLPSSLGVLSREMFCNRNLDKAGFLDIYYEVW